MSTRTASQRLREVVTYSGPGLGAPAREMGIGIWIPLDPEGNGWVLQEVPRH